MLRYLAAAARGVERQRGIFSGDVARSCAVSSGLFFCGAAASVYGVRWNCEEEVWRGFFGVDV